MTFLRAYQKDICKSVREAFGKHRSVMMQMPTGTGKTVVLVSLVRQYLDLDLRND
ncbi:MAG: DEAD/DEAH box helicase family protein, partial [Bacteroides sp.]